MSDAEARRTIREALDQSLLVEASAGTGKTTELVHRLVALLASGRAEIDRIVAVTFTKKAAGELKLRLRFALDAERGRATDPAVRARLGQAIARLEEAHVGTIHGFAAELLRRRPVEAGIDPDFRELGAGEDRALFSRVFRRFVESKLRAPPPGLARALLRPLGNFEDGSTLDQLEDATWGLVEHRDLDAAWRRPPFELEAEVRPLIERLRHLAARYEASARPNDKLAESLEPVRTLVRSWPSEGPSDLFRLEAELASLFAGMDDARGRGNEFAPGVPKGVVLGERQALLEDLRRFVARANQDIAALLRAELDEALELYRSAKTERGVLDFLDLLTASRDLVRDHPEVRAHFQRSFTHLFVDELQDTDPLQLELLLLLAADDPAETDWRQVRPSPGKLFLVGDPKQSIYRFRRADLGFYERLKPVLEAAGVPRVVLSTSFRATAPIQAIVNRAFAPEFDGGPGQASYVPLDPGDAAEVAPQPSIVVLPVPNPFGQSGVVATAIDAAVPELVTSWLGWLFADSGFRVRERGELVPVAPRHVALLFRNFRSGKKGDLTLPFQRAFERAGIRHAVFDDKSFADREEIDVVRTALTALEWPDDELSVYATLRGPLFAIPDELLFRYRHAVGPLRPIERPTGRVPAELTAIPEALDLLAELHEGRNERPFARTLGELFDRTRAHAGFALWRGGERVLASVRRVLDLARAHEAAGGVSFRSFVEWLAEAGPKSKLTSGAELDEATDGVRLVTVHSAKGLEFPVVVLADPTTTGNWSVSAASFVDERLHVRRLLQLEPAELRDRSTAELAKDGAESVRLAYVASTRARDLLVTPAVGSEVYRRSWLAPLLGALHPNAEEQRRVARTGVASGFGPRSVLAADPRGHGPPFSVPPGLYRGGALAWWDPALLSARPPAPETGLAHESWLTGGDSDAKAKSRAAHEAWRDARALARAQGARPSVQPVAATTIADDPPVTQRVEEHQLRKKPKASGRRFGTLVHTLFAHVPLDADRVTISRFAESFGRGLRATAKEIIEAVPVVEAILGSPLVLRAAAAPRCHRELPVALDIADVGALEGDLLDGVIDLAFREEGADPPWTVVELKTGDERRAEADRRQAAWYAHALQVLTGEPARAVILRV